MIKPEIPYSGWTRCNMYPKFSRQEGALTVTDRFFCAESIFDVDDLASLESFTYMGLAVSGSSADVNETEHLIYVTLVYSNTNSDTTSSATEGVSEYTMEDSGQEIPIDMKKKNGSFWFTNYRTKMNYILAAHPNADTSTPSFWTDATDTVIDGNDGLTFRWCKEPSDMPDGWRQLKGKTKRIETVLVPAPVVVETTKYRGYTQAVAKQKVVGTKVTPARTFGYNGEWLVMSSNVYSDGRKWVCQTRYQHAEEWDEDFYA